LENDPEHIAYRLAEAARLIGVSVATFRRWRSEGVSDLPRIITIGGVQLIARPDLVAFIERRKIGNA
jgi:predicted site-specific integrase-resolvase